MIKAILFDLDGTLLPMDQDEFIRAYFSALCEKFVPQGYDPKRLIKSLWSGTEKMVLNDGTKTNEEVFWDDFKLTYPEINHDKSKFDDFYANEFNKVKDVCGKDIETKFAIKEIESRGIKTILATNPIFPRVCTYNRLSWTGLTEEDFIYISTYENSSYCKPNIKYYEEILNKLQLKPEECLMVGNDCNEDMVVTKIGMPFFLITRNTINKNNVDIKDVPQGTFFDLLNYLNSLN